MATTVKENSKITMRDIAKVFWRWQFTCEMSNSYERMQAIAFCFAMIPVLKKLYPNKEDFVEALQRHLVFFNTEGTIGSVIVGMTVALEEEKVASDGASILGLFIVGGLAASNVSLNLTGTYMSAGTEKTIQSVIDGIVPGLLPLALIMGLCYYFSKNKGNQKFGKVVVGLLVLGVLLALLGLV